MRCVITGNSVKLFAKAIHCLAKIGEDIYLEPLTKGLSLRTVNSSRSAYACFLFAVHFFQSYDNGNPSNNDAATSSEDGLKCKLSVKSCLSVFKSLSTIERIVERCSIKMDITEETLTFLLYCRHGITKTYNLGYQDCESLQAVFTKNLCPNVIQAQPRIFSEVITNFQNTQEEITLTVCPQEMKITNYVDDEPDPDNVIHTEMVLVAEEFNNYQIGVDTEVTFCLKELKAILSFAESSCQPMDIHFECGGKPIVFSLTSDSTFEANFVLATLIDQTTPSQSSQVKTQPKQSQSKNRETTINEEDEFVLGLDDESALVEVVEKEMEKEMVKEIQKRGETSKGVRTKNKENPFKNVDIDDDEDFFGDAFPYQDLFAKKDKKSHQTKTKPTQDDREERNEKSFHRVNSVQTQPSVVSTGSLMKYTEMPSLGGSISANSENSPGIAVRSGKLNINTGRNNKDGGRKDQDGGRNNDRGRKDKDEGRKDQDRRRNNDRGRKDQDEGRKDQGRKDQDRGRNNDRGRKDKDEGRKDQDRRRNNDRGRKDQDEGRKDQGRKDQDGGRNNDRGRKDKDEGRKDQDRRRNNDGGRKDQDGRRKDQDRMKDGDEKHFTEQKCSEESVPGTPPSKKFKSMFFSAVSAGDSFNKTTIELENAVVLAADTDEESD